MKRLNENTVEIQPGEIIDHEELFSLGFGQPGTVVQNVVWAGDNPHPTHITVGFKTGNLTEVVVGYGCTSNQSNMFMLAPHCDMRISKDPDAQMGDDDNIAEQVFGWGRTGSKTNCLTFMGIGGKDPKGETTKRSYDFHRKMFVEKVIPARPDGGLIPGTQFYYNQSLPEGGQGIGPMVVRYFGTDQPQFGGEVEMEPELVIEPIDIPDEGVGAVEVYLGPIMGAGIFIPHDDQN